MKTATFTTSDRETQLAALSRYTFQDGSQLSDFLARIGMTPAELLLDPACNYTTSTQTCAFYNRHDRDSLANERSLTTWGVETIARSCKAPINLVLDAANECLSPDSGARPKSEMLSMRGPAVPPADRSDPNLERFQIIKRLADLESQLYRWRALPASQVFSELADGLGSGIPRTVTGMLNGTHTAGSKLMRYLLSFCNERALPAEPTESRSYSSMESAHCICDETRTGKFLSAIRTDIATLLQSKNSLHVVDAGCGALPVLSVQAALSNPNVHVTALELNRRSAAIAEGVVRGMGLSDQITVVCADATSYAPVRPVDLLISETIQSGLAGEPVVKVLNHLHQFLAPEGLCLPRSIEVTAGVLPRSQLSDPERRTVQTVSEDTKITEPIWLARQTFVPGTPLENLWLRFAVDKPEHRDSFVVVGSEIDLGSQKLLQNESLITMASAVDGMIGHQIFHGIPIDAGLPPTAEVVVSYAPGGDRFGVVVGCND